MSDVLILYASKHGHTAKIARRIADAMSADGASPHVQSADSAGEVPPAGYDLVVVGASIHAGHHQREIVDWAKQHQAEAIRPTPRATSTTRTGTRSIASPTSARPRWGLDAG
jgi:menaquinone-dependent protoporphyrinogen oxidase